MQVPLTVAQANAVRGPVVGFPAMRAALIKLGWPSGYPTTVPPATTVPGGMGYFAIGDPNALVSQDRVTVTIPPFGAQAIIEVIHPKVWNGRVVLFHAGHGERPYDGSNPLVDANGSGLCLALTAAGYRIMCVCMPLYGPNPSPLTLSNGMALQDLIAFGDNHGQFAQYEWRTGFSSLPLFYECAIQAINYACATYGVTFVDMMGHSGGGQAVDFVSAMDTRVRRSYAIEGTLPFSLWSTIGKVTNSGDFESNLTCREYPTTLAIGPSAWWPIFGNDITNMYVLGCLEAGRKRTQMFGDGDPVFPVAPIHAQIAAYAATVAGQIAGQHAIFIDPACTFHAYTAPMISAIVADLALP